MNLSKAASENNDALFCKMFVVNALIKNSVLNKSVIHHPRFRVVCGAPIHVQNLKREGF